MKKFIIIIKIVILGLTVSCAPEKISVSSNISASTTTMPNQLSDITVSKSITMTTAQKSSDILLEGLPDGAYLETTTSFTHTSLNSTIAANSSLLVYTLSEAFINSVSETSSFNDIVQVFFVKDDLEFTYTLNLQVNVISSDSATPPEERVVTSQYPEVLQFRNESLEQTITIPDYNTTYRFLSASFIDSSFEEVEFNSDLGSLTLKSANLLTGQSFLTGEIKTFNLEGNEIVTFNVRVDYISTKFTLVNNGVPIEVDFGALGFGLGDKYSEKELLSTNLNPAIDIGFTYSSQRLADPLDEDHLDLVFEPIVGGTRATFSPVDLNLLEAGDQPDREYEVIFTLETGDEVVAVYEVHFSVFELDGERTELSVSGLMPNTAAATNDERLLNSIRRPTPFDLKEAHVLFTTGQYAILEGFECDLYNENGNIIDKHFSAEVSLSSVNGRQFNVDANEATYGNGDDFFMFCFGSIIDLEDGEIFKTIDRRIYNPNSFEDLNKEEYWSDKDNLDSEKTLMWHWRK